MHYVGSRYLLYTVHYSFPPVVALICQVITWPPISKLDTIIMKICHRVRVMVKFTVVGPGFSFWNNVGFDRTVWMCNFSSGSWRRKPNRNVSPWANSLPSQKIFALDLHKRSSRRNEVFYLCIEILRTIRYLAPSLPTSWILNSSPKENIVLWSGRVFLSFNCLRCRDIYDIVVAAIRFSYN